MGPGATITASGFANSGETGTLILELEGSDAHVFGNEIQFDSTSGKAVLHVAPHQIVIPDHSFVLRFKVKNGLHAQKSRRIQIEAFGAVPCAHEVVGGIALSCPESVTIAPAPMDGLIFSSETFVIVASVTSSLCSYPQCKHSFFYGAENRISVNVTVPAAEAALHAGSRLSIHGLQASASASVDATVSATLVGLRRTGTGASDPGKASAICSCDTPLCACEHVFTGLPLGLPIRLRAQVECNTLGWASLGVDQIRVRIGNTGVFTVQDDLNVPDRACEGNCSRQFDLFALGFQVGELVSPLGELYVTIEGNAEVDLCGKGHFLMAVLGLEWTPASGTAHSAVVVATWKGGAGQLDVSVPKGFYAVGSVVVSFVLRNPLDAHPGSHASIQVVTPQGSIYGPAPATGSLVMQASRQAAVSVASMIESTRIQGALNMLQLELAFNGQIVASDAGVWITIRGLFNSSTPSSHGLACLKLGACTDCEPAGVSSSAAPPPQSAAVDLAALITLPDRGCANWDQEVGELAFHLRAPGPTYLIDHTKLRAVVPLRNSMAPLLGALPLVSVGGSLVPGTSSVPKKSFGSKRMFAARESAHVLRGHLDYDESIAYAHPRILVKFTAMYGVMHGDVVTVALPLLTTCNVFCYEGQVRCSCVAVTLQLCFRVL